MKQTAAPRLPDMFPFGKPPAMLCEQYEKIAQMLRPLGRTGLSSEAKPQLSGHQKRKLKQLKEAGEG